VLKLVIAVIAIALPDSINPSLIAGQLLVATGEQPRRRVIGFTAAAFAVTLAFGLLMALGLGELILSLVPTPGRTVKYSLITAAGTVLVVGGIVIWFRRNALVADTPTDHLPGSTTSPVLIGGGIAGFELLTAFPYFAAIALIVGSGVSRVEKLSLVVLYCLVYTLPLIAIVVVFALLGDRAERVLRPVDAWLSAHWPLVLAPVTGLLGLGVLVFGAVQLSAL
jgi:cytochrome c biogenesis protein CcdA